MTGIGRCGGGRYGGGHYDGGRTAEDATAELFKKGWTLRRSHQNPAIHNYYGRYGGDTAESLQYNDVSVSVTVQENLSIITRITN